MAAGESKAVITLEIEGSIGSGKSTLAKALVKHRGGEVLPETVNEPLLEAFYAAPKEFAFAFQLYMLQTRLHQMDLAEKCKEEKGWLVLDRGVVGDTIFASLQHAQGNMTDQQYGLYKAVCKQRFPRQLSDRVDVLVYLDVSPQTCLKRVEQRSRTAEEKLPLEYLEALDLQYFHLLIDWLGGRLDGAMNIARNAPPVVVLPWEEYGTVEAVAARIAECSKHQPKVTFVTASVEGALDQEATERAYAQLSAPSSTTPLTVVTFDWSQPHSNAFRRVVMHHLAAARHVQFVVHASV